MLKKNKPSCWIIVEEGLPGTENQCRGVAEALGVKAEVRHIKLKWPWSALSPFIGLDARFMYKPPFALQPPYPELLITAGRKAVAASRIIRNSSRGKTFTVQLQDPKVNSQGFDLVAAPYHDQVKGINVVHTDGAPNRITPERLQKAKVHFAPLFEPLDYPRYAVIIGGNSRTHNLSRVRTESLIEELLQLQGSMMITVSRRTGEDNMKLLRSVLDTKGNYFWDGSGENPYFGMLAWADQILVTEDSVSMISDAATTGKPVHIMDVAGGSARLNRFKDHMKALGAAKDFNVNTAMEPWGYEPLNDAQKVADAVKKRLKDLYEWE